MSENFRLDCKIDFQNMLYIKCINIIIDRSITLSGYILDKIVRMCNKAK